MKKYEIQQASNQLIETLIYMHANDPNREKLIIALVKEIVKRKLRIS